jgi:hypothetical protein
MIQTHERAGVLLPALLQLTRPTRPAAAVAEDDHPMEEFGKRNPMRRQHSRDSRFSSADGGAKKSEVGLWRMAKTAGDVTRSLHPRRLCNRGRIPDDGLLWRTDRARHESPHV